MANEQISLSELARLTNSLDAATCRMISKALEEIDSKEAPAEDILVQEKNWAHKSMTLRVKILTLWDYKVVRENRQKFVKAYHLCQLRRRLVMVDFASRSYELEKHIKPVAVKDLVPGWLTSVPLDPIGGTNVTFATRPPIMRQSKGQSSGD